MKSRTACIWLCLIFILSMGTMKLSAQAVTQSEYALKAAFMYNFARFVEWPSEAFEDSLSPLVIGVLGVDPFGISLEETILGEIVNDRPMAVRRFRDLAEVGNCQILFISSSEAGRIEEIVSKLRGRSILTVADTEGFAKKGVMIRFVKAANKIRFKINVEAARAAGLSINSKLLRLAEIVSSGK